MFLLLVNSIDVGLELVLCRKDLVTVFTGEFLGIVSCFVNLELGFCGVDTATTRIVALECFLSRMNVVMSFQLVKMVVREWFRRRLIGKTHGTCLFLFLYVFIGLLGDLLDTSFPLAHVLVVDLGEMAFLNVVLKSIFIFECTSHTSFDFTYMCRGVLR